MTKEFSTVPGLSYPPYRDHLSKSGFQFLKSRKEIDGAENLWRIRDNLYNLEPFIKNHPGGSEWISMTRGTDITEAFEVHHILDNAEKLLPKFFVRKAEIPRKIIYTFQTDGFYQKFKERARKALEHVDIHNNSVKSKRIADTLAILTFIFAIATSIYKSWIVILISAVLLAWTVIVAHNFFHSKDNFRMYYFDLSMMSSKEWRIAHVLSHHLYPNTLWDLEISGFEPFLEYLPKNNKSKLKGFMYITFSFLIFCLTFLKQGTIRYYSIFLEWKCVEMRDIIPFSLPIVMSFFCSSILESVKLWLLILLLASFVFTFTGVTAAHHHPNIFHDGDICRKELDWGLMELDAVRDRKIIDDSLFLTLISFGSHSIHHLLPTLDHAFIELCVPAYLDTCEEFGITFDRYNQWELIKGHYKQLLRDEPKINYR